MNPAASNWRKIASELLRYPTLPNSDLTAKLSVNGSVCIITSTPESFRYDQTTLKKKLISFTTFSHSEDRTVKVVIRGIPAYISEDEVNTELANYGFDVKLVKHFG